MESVSSSSDTPGVAEADCNPEEAGGKGTGQQEGGVRERSSDRNFVPKVRGLKAPAGGVD